MLYVFFGNGNPYYIEQSENGMGVINAAKNIKYYLERFSREFCSYDTSFNQYDSLKYITKECVRKTITHYSKSLFQQK